MKGFALSATLVLAVWAQHVGAQSGPTFDVVSIKASRSDEPGSRAAVQAGGRLTMTNVPLSAVVLTAFELADYNQVDGLPEWTHTERFDIEARAPVGVPIAFPGQGTPLPRMLQAMLADRMQLAAHVEKRSTAMFALVTARGDGRLGPQLSRSSIDCTTALSPPAASAALPGSDASRCGIQITRTSFSGRGLPLDRVIRLIIAPRVGRPVVDRTGLTGTFDIALRYRAPDPPPGAGLGGSPVASLDPDLSPIETAVQEQLGLRLQPVREPANVLVISRIERPTPN